MECDIIAIGFSTLMLCLDCFSIFPAVLFTVHPLIFLDTKKEYISFSFTAINRLSRRRATCRLVVFCGYTFVVGFMFTRNIQGVGFLLSLLRYYL